MPSDPIPNPATEAPGDPGDPVSVAPAPSDAVGGAGVGVGVGGAGVGGAGVGGVGVGGAPPVTPGPLRRTRRRIAWPSVLGIIAIIMGSFAALGGIGGLATPLFTAMVANVPQPAGAPPMNAMQDFTPLLMLHGLLAIILAALLIVGGAGLLQRRPWSVRIVILWAILKIPSVLVGAVLAAFAQQVQFDATFAAMQQTGAAGAGAAGAAPVALMTTIMKYALWGGLAFALLWGWLLPIIMLCILTQRSIRAQATTWQPVPHSSFTIHNS